MLRCGKGQKGRDVGQVRHMLGIAGAAFAVTGLVIAAYAIAFA